MPAENYHTTVLIPPAGNHISRNQNGIIRSFVASKKNYLFFKRFFDLLFSTAVILLVMSWLLPVVSLLIKINSTGSIFFIQNRVGKGGRIFKCIKFRTMMLNAEADEVQVEKNDSRITGVGKFLRRLNIDELPQFFNVLMGDMSVVGPRPHMIADCIRFSFVISSYSFRSLVRPGITGLAQVHGYHGPTPDYESIIVRYYWDAGYIRKANFLLDMKIIGITIMQSMKNLVGVLLQIFQKGKKNTITVEIHKSKKVAGERS